MYSYDKITQLKETDPSLAVILRQLNDRLTMTKHPKNNKLQLGFLYMINTAVADYTKLLPM